MSKKEKTKRARIPRGWDSSSLTSNISARELKRYSQPNLLRIVGLALCVWLAIWGAAVIGYQVFLETPAYSWIPLNLCILVGIAAALRAIEGFVHAGSHYHWCSNRLMNDLATNVLAALPVFSLVQHYRSGHQLHHSRFGSADDPEVGRYFQLDLPGLDRRSMGAFFLGMVKRLPRYFWAWWDQIRTTPKVLMYSMLWHVGILIPIAIACGVKVAIALWVVYFLIPIVFILTVIRFITETAEHDYIGRDRNGGSDGGSQVTATSELESTNSNIGRIHRWFLHPFNDGWHAVHHLRPTIPFWNLKKIHRLMVEVDPLGYGRHHFYRTRVLQIPMSGGTIKQ